MTLVSAGWLAFGASPVLARGRGPSYQVTFVARWCPAYTDIFANRARNDIVESLQDLGPDTQYDDTGILINPAYEKMPPQDRCQSIPQWEFTLGTGYQSRAVTGVWGSLSKVTNPYSTGIVTKVLTPLLNDDGSPVPFRFVAGAVTIRLTPDQAQEAGEPDRLWAQGGTPDDPVLAQKFGTVDAPEYAFGTLRCASDNLNGDNVEFIYFPAGVTHVFCYALYVKPPPPSGTITINKQVVGAPAGTDPKFLFPGGCTGCLSFDPGGFTLGDGGSATFYRAAGNAGTTLPTWTVAENPVADYTTSVSCQALAPGGGPGESMSDVSGATVTIHLAAGEHVTCTYTNTYVPPPGGLRIAKITEGGVGTFAYDVSPASGSGATQRVSISTTEPGVPASADLTALAPGDYQILERVPKPPGGTWRRVSVDCDGQPRSTTTPVTVTITSGKSAICTFTNALIQKGSISLAKITEGATGTASFQVEPTSGTPAQYLQTATTTTPGVAADAVPDTPADKTNRLRLATYRIIEEPPFSTPANAWTLTQVECNGVLVPFAQGTAEVTLTKADPNERCVFTDVFSSTPPPEPGPQPPEPLPPEPHHPPGVNPDEPSAPWADLAVTKTASPSVVVSGDVITYRITVTNHGPNDSARVVLDDKPAAGAAAVVSVHSSAGACQVGLPVVCQLGTLKPGAKVTIMLSVRAGAPTHGFTNRAVVGTATFDPELSNNAAHATVKVLPPPPPVGLG
jgi:uncharacterized repeat protein (TIGR01451 family)